MVKTMDYLGTINAKKKSQNKYRLFEYLKSKDALDICRPYLVERILDLEKFSSVFWRYSSRVEFFMYNKRQAFQKACGGHSLFQNAYFFFLFFFSLLS